MRIRNKYLSFFLRVLSMVLLLAGRHLHVAAQKPTDTNRVPLPVVVDIPDTMIAVNARKLQACIKANDADGAFMALINSSIVYMEKYDFQQERDCSIRALPWALKSTIKDATAWCYNNIGLSYFGEGDYALATENYYRALDELKKMQGPPTHTNANVYNNLGMVYERLGEPDKALADFQQAENISRQENLGFQLANSLTNKGEYYNSIHQSDSALKFFNEIMQIGKQINKADLIAQAYDDLGKTYIMAGAYQKAVPLLRAAVSIGERRYPYIAVDASCSLGDALCRTGSYKESEAILLAALAETRAHNFKDNYITCYTGLTALYKATGRYEKAMEYMDSASVLKDSLLNAEKAKAINQMEIKYKTAEKDKQIARNELLIAQQKSKIIRKNIWIGVIAGSIFLLAVVVVALAGRSRNKERIQAEQIRSLQQENKIGVLSAMVQGEENERRRIARDLHDGIGGMLSAAMMRLRAIRHENEAVTTIAAYREALALLDDMGDEIRRTSHNLMPEVLMKQTLPEAIGAYCHYVQEGGSLVVDFQSYGIFDKVTQEAKLNIYRIVQELLKNTLEHAQATHAFVQLQINEQMLAITVEDNGSGFNKEEVKHGIGLHNLQTRVSSMDGHYTLESEPGKGTSVDIEFDLKHITAKP